MRFIVVTGMSGAGKSQVIHGLEDLGYFCVDNLPPALLGVFVDLLKSTRRELSRVAVSMDCRSGEFFNAVGGELAKLHESGVPYELVFLDASDEALITRYKENRRTHPLSDESGVSGGVTRERELLAPLRETANLLIDTSQMHVRELHETVLKYFTKDDPDTNTSLVIKTFGFKNGVPTDADMVYDVRFLPNPFYIESMRGHTGLEQDVRDYVFSFETAHAFSAKACDMISMLLPLYQNEGRRQLIVCVGCTGGRHRSVALAEHIGQTLSEQGFKVSVRHRDIAIG